MNKFDPDKDGVDHINVYSHGRTALGRKLTNFANTPFKHPQYGWFSSVEGLWYFIKSGMKHDNLRRLYGASAKAQGIQFAVVPMDEDEFRKIIREAIHAKVMQNPDLYKEFIESELPFVHYYVYGSKVIPKDKHHWQMEYLEQLRSEIKASIVETPQTDV